MKKCRFYFWCAGMIFFLLLPACGKGKKAESEKTNPAVPFGEITLFQSIMGYEFRVAWCDKGILTAESAGENSGEGKLLYFTEFGTGKKYLLCSDVYCAHEPASQKNPDPVCEATMQDLVNACIYGSNLYVIQQNGFFEGMTIFVRDLMKKGYRKLVELPYSDITNVTAWSYDAVIGTKMYLFVGEIDEKKREPEIGFNSNDVQTILLEVDLSTGKYKELLRLDLGKERYQVLNAAYQKEGIYLLCYYTDSYMDENLDPVIVEHKETMFYVPYDGTEPTRISTRYLEERMSNTTEYVWGSYGTDGFYLSTAARDRIDFISYESGEVKNLYTLEEGYEEIRGYLWVSGDILLFGLKKDTGERECVYMNVKTGKQKRTAEKNGEVHYAPVAEGIFTESSLINSNSGGGFRVYDLNDLEWKLLLDTDL